MTKQKQPTQLPAEVPVNIEFEKMLKNFLKDVNKSGILREVRDRMYYKKPSQVRREKLSKGKRR